LSIWLPLPYNTPLLIDPARHILHNTIQLPVNSLLHLLLRKFDRDFAQSTLHLRPGILNVYLTRHPSQPLTDLLSNNTPEFPRSQLMCLSLPEDFLQSAHIARPHRRSRRSTLRAHEIGQLLAVTLGVLTSLALDGSELFLEPAHFAVFCVVGLLGLFLGLLEVLEAFVDFGSGAVCGFHD
jgi:hypothetical protein